MPNPRRVPGGVLRGWCDVVPGTLDTVRVEMRQLLEVTVRSLNKNGSAL